MVGDRVASERVVKVKLSATMDQYVAGMDKAAKSTREVGTEAEKLAQQKRAFELVGRSAFAMGGLMAAGLGVAVAKFAEFDQAMSYVQAATHESAEAMESLRVAAIDAGASTVFSATESANAIEELAKAGVSTKDILGGGLAGALDLAAAGGLGVADAAGIAATALQTFGLEGSDMAHVADLLAAGAGKAMGDVSDLSMALNQSALVANATGLSIEETTASLSAFAAKGLLGSDAGTSFKSMLQRLTPQSAEAKQKMDELGISAYDAGGQFIGMEKFAGNLQDSLSGLTDEQRNSALATIFGTDAVRAANVIYEEGASGIAEWTGKVNDAGYAAETAATRLDNLKGDWEKLSGAVDSALIGMGEAADGPLRFVLQEITGLVDGFNEMPAAGQQAVFWIGAAGSAALIAYGSYLLLVPKVAEYNSALALMGPNAQRAGRALASVAKGVGLAAGVAVVITAASNALVDYAREVRGTDEAVDQATTTSLSFLKAMEALGVTSDASVDGVTRALDALRKGDTFGSVGLDVLTLRDALTELDGGLKDLPLENAVTRFQSWGKGMGLTAEQMETMLDEMPGLKQAIGDQLKASGEAADEQAILNFAMKDGVKASKDNEDALRALAGQAVTAGGEVDGLADQIRNFGSATLSTRDAQRQFEQAFDDLTASITENGATLDINEQAGRDNQASLDDMAKSSLELAAATYEQTGSQDQANAVLATGRDRLIEMLGQFGITGQAAEDYADDLGLIPANIQTYVALNTDAATSAMYRFIDTFNGTRLRLNVATDSFEIPGQATGGPVIGPGTGTSDSVLRRLSNGEHVWTAAEVKDAGGHAEVERLRRGQMTYGSNGPVAASSTPSSVSLENATITGTFEMGDGFVRLIDGRISANDQAQLRSTRGRTSRI